MHTQVDKTGENKSQAVANAVFQKQGDGESTFQFVDNRPEVGAQRKLQGIVNNSSQSKQISQLQVMAAKALQTKAKWVSTKVGPVVQPKGKPPKASSLSNGEVIQRSISLVSTESNTWDLALRRANRDETSGFTPPVVNGVEYAPGLGGNWVNANLLNPTITTVQGQDDIYRARVTAVPANAVGYNMYLPAPPGPWHAVAGKEYILGYYGIEPREGAGNVNLRVVGHPDNSTFLQKVKAHEGIHANDINRAINAILVPWDDALQQCMRDGTEFQGATQAEAENVLWEAVGGNPLQITGRLDAQWTIDNDAYHDSHEGGSNVQNATYDAGTNTVTLSIMINQPLPEGRNWLMLGTVVVLALALVGGLLAKNHLNSKDR